MPDTLASCRWIGVTETGSATTSPPGAPFKPAGQGPRSSVTSVEVAASLSFEGRKGTRPPPSEPDGCPLCAQDILEEEGPLRSCHSLTSGNVWALTTCRRTCASGVGLGALKLPFSPRGFAFPPLSSCSDVSFLRLAGQTSCRPPPVPSLRSRGSGAVGVLGGARRRRRQHHVQTEQSPGPRGGTGAKRRPF